MIINITQEDIDKAKIQEGTKYYIPSRYCALAITAKRVIGRDDILCGFSSIIVVGLEKCYIPITEDSIAVETFTSNFDSKNPVHPVSFTFKER